MKKLPNLLKELKNIINDFFSSGKCLGWILLFVVLFVIGIFKNHISNLDLPLWILLIGSFITATLFAFLPQILLLTMSLIFLIISWPMILIEHITEQKRKYISSTGENNDIQNDNKKDS